MGVLIAEGDDERERRDEGDDLTVGAVLAEPFDVSVPVRTVPDDDLETALVEETLVISGHVWSCILHF